MNRTTVMSWADMSESKTSFIDEEDKFETVPKSAPTSSFNSPLTTPRISSSPRIGDIRATVSPRRINSDLQILPRGDERGFSLKIDTHIHDVLNGSGTARSPVIRREEKSSSPSNRLSTSPVFMPSVTSLVSSAYTGASEASVCALDLNPYYQRLNELSKTPTFRFDEVRKNPKIQVSDDDGSLTMLCYSRAVEHPQIDPLTSECRGLVYDADRKLISRAFSYTPMYTPGTLPSDIAEFITENFDMCKFFVSYEGALVRAFYHGSEWYLTTHRKLDAFKSFWSSRISFGQIFQSSLVSCIDKGRLPFVTNRDNPVPEYLNSLDKKKQYVFLTRAIPETRIVSTPPVTTTSIHVATFENGVMVDDTVPTGVEMQAQLKFRDLEAAFKWTETSASVSVCQGLVVYLPNGKQIKICNPEYMELFNLRGNESSVMFRYLQLRNTNSVSKFRMLYPEHKERFDLYETVIVAVASELYKLYQERFIRKRLFNLEKEDLTVISSLHQWFKKRRLTNPKVKTTLKDTIDVLNQIRPTDLNKLIRRWQLKTKVSQTDLTSTQKRMTNE